VALAPGTPAPDFRLATGDRGHITRDDLKGRTAVLVFWTFWPPATERSATSGT